MLALSYAQHNASTAHHHCAERMPASQPMFAASMCMGAAASAASATIIRTDVLASVFLFVVVLLVCSLLLVSLVVLISLLLTGLTGLISLEGLVGHGIRLDTSTAQGD
jgi:hypothetical protein